MTDYEIKKATAITEIKNELVPLIKIGRQLLEGLAEQQQSNSYAFNQVINLQQSIDDISRRVSAIENNESTEEKMKETKEIVMKCLEEMGVEVIND